MNEVHQYRGGTPLIAPFNRAGKPAKDSYVTSIIAFAAPGLQRMMLPQREWQSSQTINDDGLRYQQKDGHFDNDQLFRLRDDTQRDDECCRTRGRVIGAQQHHECAGEGKRKCGSQDPRPIDAGMYTKGQAGSTRKGVGTVTADESDGMAKDRIPRAGVSLERRNEEQVSRWTERRKDEGGPGYHREQCQQSNRQEAIHQNVNRPHNSGRKVFKQPGQPQPRQEHRNVLMSSDAAAYAMASQRWSSGRSSLRWKIEFLVVLLLAALTGARLRLAKPGRFAQPHHVPAKFVFAV